MRKSFKIKNLIRNNRYAFLSRGEEKNLLANEMSLQILGGGQLCGSNEPTPSRISKFASSLRNSALPLGEGQTKSGGADEVWWTKSTFTHWTSAKIQHAFLRHPATRKNASSGHSYLAGSQKKTGAGWRLDGWRKKSQWLNQVITQKCNR